MPIGATFGVEEEYHLVDPETVALVARPDLADSVPGLHLHTEMLASQLEAVTDVCTELGELRAALQSARREAAAAAGGAGAALLATSTHPFASLTETQMVDKPRYEVLLERFGAVARALNLTGCHVHVGVPDFDAAVQIMNRVRPYLALFGALTASSPFHEGADTGYASFRLAWLGLWPQGGYPPVVESADEYRAVLDGMIATGLIADQTEALWEVRPSARYPTLEFRIADTCTDIDDAILFAALARSLTRTIGARLDRPEPMPAPAEPVLRAARWRAARFGMTGSLFSPAHGQLVPADVVLQGLLDELRPDLDEHDEWTIVADLVGRLRARGTSAQRQRATYEATGDLAAVTRDAVALTALD